MDIILASSSAYRRQLLSRLQLKFRCLSPQTVEARQAGESPAAMAARLARAKAASIGHRHPAALVIGSDQVAALDGEIMGKPGTHERARAQLRASSGRTVNFHTGVAVCCIASGFERFHVEPFSVHFRDVDDKSIDYYLRSEQPYDCAGSFKCEGLGIALFERLEGRDPTSLEGLPLIALTGLLGEAGMPVLSGNRH